MSKETDVSMLSATAVTSNNTVSSEEAQSTRTESKFIYKWTVIGFNCTTAKDGEHFPDAKFKCKLNSGLCLKGGLLISGKECCYRTLSLSLDSLSDEKWSVICYIWLNDNRESMETWLFSEEKTSQKKDLYQKKKCLLNEDINVINCEIVHVVYKQMRNYTFLEAKECSLPTALEELYKHKTLYDVSFVVGGVEVKAHKCLLMHRSKFFAKLLDVQDASPVCTKSIVIEDIEPAVFNEILHYIYTDKTPNLYQMPSRLLIASEKYGLENMKRICERELANKITIDTAAEILILADVNKAENLKIHTMAFIKAHSRAVADTTGWQNIIKNYNHLLAELYSNIIQ